MSNKEGLLIDLDEGLFEGFLSLFFYDRTGFTFRSDPVCERKLPGNFTRIGKGEGLCENWIFAHLFFDDFLFQNDDCVGFGDADFERFGGS